MYRSRLWAACMFAVAIGGSASGAQAGTILFTGTRVNVDAPGPQAARCGARTTINIRPGPNSTSIGTSNLGGFVPVLSHCIQLPLPAAFDLGEFNFDFGGGHTIFGTYEGTVGPVVQGSAALSQTHVITGGTGKFLNATGGFTSAGALVFGMGPPRAEQMFRGFITAAGIPEPASWALMIGGFGLAGAAVRRRMTRTVFA